MKKSELQNRYDKIVKIISRNEVSTQDQLLGMLKDYGISVSQVTVSRDLKALRIKRRLNAAGDAVYCLPDKSEEYVEREEAKKNDARNSRPLIESVAFQGTLCIIKTKPCHAQAVASVIDSLHNPLILGTVAGVDTIFMVTIDKLHNESIRAILNEQFHMQS